MKRLGKWFLCFFVLLGIAVAFDFWNQSRKAKLLSSAVLEAGGRSGSIPVWPLGAEYRVSLKSVPNEEQLDKLTIANEMRGRVSIAFEDCDLSEDEIRLLGQSFLCCHLFVVKNGQIKPIEKPEK